MTQDLMEGQNSVVMPQYCECFLNLSIAALDFIDRVQPSSRTTRVGWLARFHGVATIHAVKDYVQKEPPSI